MDSPDARKLTVDRCPVCSFRHFQYAFTVRTLRLVQCQNCGFSLINPRPAAVGNVGAVVYSKLPDAADDVRSAQAMQLLAQYSAKRGGKLLVLGSPTAVRTATSAGHAVETLVANEEERGQIVQVLGEKAGAIAIHVGSAEELAERLEGRFDACWLADVVGRVAFPERLAAAVHRLVRLHGAIVVTTPAFDADNERNARTEWMQTEPGHLSYFDRKALEGLLFATGFRQLAHCASRQAHDLMTVMGTRAIQPARPKLSIIVPVFNEAATFATAFQRLLDHPFPLVDVEFLLVESNSTDGTRDIVKRFADVPRVRLIFEDRPRGKGFAVRNGLKAATGDYVAIQDADLEYDLEDYDSVLEPLLSGRETFVLGARHGGRARKMRQFSGQPLTAAVMNCAHWFFTSLINVFFNVRLKDPFTMYKVFRRDCVHGVEFECNRFDFDWELVIKLIRRGYLPIEVPVNYRSRSFEEGKKVSFFRDPITWIRALIRFRLLAMPEWYPATAGGEAMPSNPPVALASGATVKD